MSRGFPKSSRFSAREGLPSGALRVAGMPLSEEDAKKYPPVDPQREKAVKVLMEDAAARKLFTDFLTAISYQQLKSKHKTTPGSTPEDKKAVKDNKLAIARLVKILPKEIADAVTFPKEDADKSWPFWRGVKDRQITENDEWKNGSFVYGFSKAENVGNIYGRIGKDPMVVNSKRDIESYGGAIDVEKVHALARDFNMTLWGDRQTWDVSELSPSMFFSKGEWILPPKYGSKEKWSKAVAYWNENKIESALGNTKNPHPGEQEVILYDIKFRKEGDKFYIDKPYKEE